MSRITAPVGEVTTPITLGQERQELLARLVEQAFGGELALALLEQRHQRAEAGRLQRLDDDLVARAVGIGGEPAGDDDLEALLGLEPHAAEHALPDHRLDLGALVLEREIDVAGAVRALVAGDLAAHAHVAVGVLDRALERGRQLGDGEFGDVAGCELGHGRGKLLDGSWRRACAAAGSSVFHGRGRPGMRRRWRERASIRNRPAEAGGARATRPAPNGMHELAGAVAHDADRIGGAVGAGRGHVHDDGDAQRGGKPERKAHHRDRRVHRPQRQRRGDRRIGGGAGNDAGDHQRPAAEACATRRA